MSSPIRVGIVGYGLSGRIFHGSVIPYVDGFKVTTISSSRPEQVHKDLPSVTVVPAPEDLIKSDNVDLVVITSPNTTHYPLAKLAIESGKHVVVEKPFVVSSKEGHDLIALAAKANVLLSVYQNRRWDNDFLTLRKLINEGELGDVHTYKASWDRYRPNVRPERWREQAQPGSGVLFDLGAHLIDQALVLLGRPVAVWGDVMAQREGGVTDDYFTVNIQFESGARSVVSCGTIVTLEHGHSIAAYGTKGAYTKTGLDNQEDDLRAGMRPDHADWGRDTPGTEGVLHLDGATQSVQSVRGDYLAFYRGIASSICNGDVAHPPVQAIESVRVIEVIEAAQKSSDTGVRVAL